MGRRRPVNRFGSLCRFAHVVTFLILTRFDTGAAAINPAPLPPAVERAVDFDKDIRPILEQRCFECHGPQKQKSGFRLDMAELALKGGDNGVDVIPGKSAESPLIHFVARLVPDMEMPPKGTPLTAPEIGLLRAWIDQGAKWPVLSASAPVEDPLNWWSLRPLGQSDPPRPPALPAGWSDNPIDGFVFAKLNEKGLLPSVPADKRTLIRRATYDLLGLPPASDEVESFLNDRNPDAYERLIDRLLASPQYGAQWGRHWLDVVRFGESRGFERNEIINTAWPFRDYVIRSFNQDKPFDQFIVEHLAGDVVGRGNPDAEIGAAFLVAGPYDDVGNQDAVQAQIIRANTVDEIIAATSGAFLGLTVNCARCHNHKFDPISAEDYYRFYAVFAGVHHGERTLAPDAQRREREAQLKPLEAKRTAAQQELRNFEASLLERMRSQPAEDDAFQLSPVNPHLTEDHFPAVDARMVRLQILSNNRDPRSAGGVHIDEFEVLTAEERPRNVALASAGARATGPSRRPDDFADAYAPGLVIDGQYGARWIVDGPAQLTITFPRAERIDQIKFSADRLKSLPADSGEIVFVGEYRIETSTNGQDWITVADSHARPPLAPAFRTERQLQKFMTAEDRRELDLRRRSVEEISAQIRRVPSLPVVWIGKYEQPNGPICIMKGGDPTKKGPEVQPGSLSTLSRVTAKFELPNSAPENERRLALAQWLVREDNPLTARVLANRVWQNHFGAGIVDTPSDFGKLGGLPTHPELLDWLARRLKQHGWRLKSLHREIMLSQTYMQSSAWREDAARIDADSRLLWRYPPRRLAAEEIRDTMLSVAGVLDMRMGGPGFKLYRYLQDNVATYVPLDSLGPGTYRRSVYHHNARASRLDLLTDFDAPDCAYASPRRGVTTSPLQALTLLNHSFTLDMAQALARRIECEGKDNTSRIKRGFILAYGRSPRESEMRASLQLVQEFGLTALTRALLNANEMIYLE